MTSTREEGEALVATFENASGVHMAHSELLMHVAAGSIQELARLARLGLKVLHPTEAELASAARAHLRSQRIGPEHPLTWADCGEPCQRRMIKDMRAALAALRDGK